MKKLQDYKFLMFFKYLMSLNAKLKIVKDYVI